MSDPRPAARRRSRQVALQVLYALDVSSAGDAEGVFETFADHFELPEGARAFAKDLVTGTGSVVGLPDLRSGGVLMITGLGKRFSGRYFVTNTTHAIGDSGYTTQFACRREELKE